MFASCSSRVASGLTEATDSWSNISSKLAWRATRVTWVRTGRVMGRAVMLRPSSLTVNERKKCLGSGKPQQEPHKVWEREDREGAIAAGVGSSGSTRIV